MQTSVCLSSLYARPSGTYIIHAQLELLDRLFVAGAMRATEQGERKISCFYRRPPLSLQSTVFVKISLGSHDNPV